MEKTLVFIKPDALCKRIMGNIISALEKKFRIVAIKMVWMSHNRARRFYRMHKGKSFLNPLVRFIASNPVVAMVVEGRDAISSVRRLIGDTDPIKSKRGTLRKIYARDNRHNILHSSDSKKSAKREIKFFFKKDEVFSWKYMDYHL